MSTRTRNQAIDVAELLGVRADVADRVPAGRSAALVPAGRPAALVSAGSGRSVTVRPDEIEVVVPDEWLADLHDPSLVIAPSYIGPDRRRWVRTEPPPPAPTGLPLWLRRVFLVVFLTALCVVPLTMIAARSIPPATAPPAAPSAVTAADAQARQQARAAARAAKAQARAEGAQRAGQREGLGQQLRSGRAIQQVHFAGSGQPHHRVALGQVVRTGGGVAVAVARQRESRGDVPHDGAVGAHRERTILEGHVDDVLAGVLGVVKGERRGGAGVDARPAGRAPCRVALVGRRR